MWKWAHSITYKKTKLYNISNGAAKCSTATTADPLDHTVKCNTQMIVPAGGNSAVRL